MTPVEPRYAFVVVTISTGVSQGWRQDVSGPAARDLLSSAGFVFSGSRVVPDEATAIAGELKRLADEQDIPLVVTSGGTGLAVSDVTPEATRRVIDREVPGIAEAMRSRSLEKTPMAMISRGIAGTRGRTLIVNLPGSPKAVRECLEVVVPVLPHAIALIRGDQTSH
jgi:molybdopterin adenylyltransferase